VSDTGAPWLLPYPLSSDLVRDGADAIKDLAEATATGLSAAGSEGIGPNTAQVVKLDTFTSTSTSVVDVTGLEVTITPSSTDSKILIIGQVSWAELNSNFYGVYRLGGGNAETFIGDADGVRPRGTFGGTSGANSARGMYVATLVFLDSPNTTSPVTYKVRVQGRDAGGSGASFVNRTQDDTNDALNPRGASSITVIEVEA
jgi:hypothetical protein